MIDAIHMFPRLPRLAPVAERLAYWSMPVPESGCVIWFGATRGYRYGQINVEGRHRGAHQVAWELANGMPVPQGMGVLHKCDVTFCINPDHLFLGTPLDNARDKEAKGRGNQPSGLRHGRYTKPWRTSRGDRHYRHLNPELSQGEANGRAKLTEVQVREIRMSPLGCYRASRHYGVSTTTIKNIRKGKLWSHLK